MLLTESPDDDQDDDSSNSQSPMKIYCESCQQHMLDGTTCPNRACDRFVVVD